MHESCCIIKPLKTSVFPVLKIGDPGDEANLKQNAHNSTDHDKYYNAHVQYALHNRRWINVQRHRSGIPLLNGGGARTYIYTYTPLKISLAEFTASLSCVLLLDLSSVCSCGLATSPVSYIILKSRYRC